MTGDTEIRLEINPRKQMRPYLERKERWACMVIHRRGGKTFACIQDLLTKALTFKRPGPPLRYAYIAPTRDQGKDIAFGYLVSFAGQIPGVEINRADLMITFPNKASIRIYSGESYDRMRGLYFDGVIFDEYDDVDPGAWNSVVRPTLSDYTGWATFIGTPKGRGSFWRQWSYALQQDDWFTLILKASENGIINPEELADIRKSTPEHIYQQEYECSFAIGRPGAIFSKQIEAARASMRITDNVLWFKELPVYSSFDVGAARNQKVWIWQMVGDRINYLEALSGDDECKTPADWAARLMTKRYRYGAHFLPHDACAENGGLWQDGLGTGGLSHVVGVPRQRSVWDGINLAVDAFERVHFNDSGCSDGLDALDAYHSKEERDGVTIKDVPSHDWASHYSDAFSLSHQAIKAGLVMDRSAIAARPRSGQRPTVHLGIRGTNSIKVNIRR